jgi:cellulose synthase/poly-beta-1,6-N-acetylglucosamine synthase-like glycosyltransferase
MDALIHLVFALPIAVMMLNFGITLLFRLSFKSTFIEKDYSLQPRVSVLLPCFNEGKHVLDTIESIIRNKYPTEKIEIVAVDDCSADDSFEWLQKAAAMYPQVRAFRNEQNSGKHHSLSRALKESTGEVIVCIDSDCIFAEDAISEMTACFSDPKIAAVGGRVGINNPKENIITQCQTLVYYYAFQIIKMTQNWARNVTCISGCLFAVRRERFVEIEERVKKRNWFGIGVRDGEDRYMTHLLLLGGWKTYINIDAQCWTSAPNNLRQLFMQQLRWRRSGLRDLFWTLKTFGTNLKLLHPLTIVNMTVPGALTLLWPFMYLYAIMNGWTTEHLLMDLQLYFGIYMIVGLLFNWYAHHNNPEQKINPLAVAVLGVWFIVDSFFTTLLALCTFDVGEWGTRGTSTQKA